MDILERLLDHDRWATEQVLAKTGGLPDTALDEEFDVGHRTLRETIDHIIGAREGWTALMTHTPPPDHPDDRPIAYQEERFARAHGAFAETALRIRDENRLDDTFPDFYGIEATYGSAILMNILHSEGHRNECVHMLTRLGLPADELEFDYGLWDFVRRGMYQPAEG
jgi:uncharacterized damage-inducible protein DinB